MALAMAVVPAFAQSTGTEAEETVIVTGQTRGKGGLIVPEKVTKTRSVVNQDYMKQQTVGQSPIQLINLLPGVNFTNNDPYGSSGGNVVLRGFDNARISLTADGIPLNDTGNYALFSNQLFDSEIIQRTTVNQGTTDVDSPTASATGGTINVATRRPDEEFGVRITNSIGSFGYGRVFASVDTGTFGPWGTSAYVTASYQRYDKFEGLGQLEKKQFNGKIYQPLGEGDDFISIAFHYNENRNNSYRNGNKASFAFYGDDYAGFVDVCNRDQPTFGVRDDDNAAPFGTGGGRFMNAADNPANPSACANYWNVRINPSDTGNIRGQSSFTLTDSLRLTVDPSFQFVRATGGSGNAVYSETDGRLRGSNAAGTGFAGAGVDLNRDGDLLDNVRMNSTNITNTYRYGVTASLIWEINESHTLRAAYTLDYGRHLQSGAISYLDAAGAQLNVFAGNQGEKIYGNDGSLFRVRDRKSIAKLNQFALSYTGLFMEDRLRVNIGLRAPFFERELNQYCFSQDASSNVLCTTQPFTVLANTNVVFAGSTTQYVRPFQGVIRKYDDILPNVGVSYEVAEDHIIYASYAAGLSAPRTDNLYVPRLINGTVVLLDSDVEKTDTFDVGYRYQGENFTASAALWYTDYSNRIANAFDQDLGFSIFRNVGAVKVKGFDVEFGWTPTEELTIYGSASYNDSEIQSDLRIGTVGGVPTFLPTKGKKFVEIPDWTVSGRIQYASGGWTFGIEGKYVGERAASDVNDEFADPYTLFSADIRYDFTEMGYEDTYFQLNVLNLFDEDYFGSISSTSNVTAQVVGRTAAGAPIIQPSSGTVFYNLGFPRTIQASFGVKF